MTPERTNALERFFGGTNWQAKVSLTIVTLFVSALFLFTNLGSYALWDDEAETALLAQGVLATGDTTAQLGHNLNARRGGINLKDLAERLTPPLPTYVMAASFAVGEESALWARLPFALSSLVAVVIMLALLWNWRAANWHFLVFTIALLGNVPFFLYFRNARYYGGVILLVTAILAIYINGLGTLWRKLAFSLLGALLLLCHPVAFMQIAAVLAVDWLFFGEKKVPNLQAILALIIPFVVIALPVISVWNPLSVKTGGEYLAQMTFLDRLTLLWWNTRDIFRAEFIPVASLIVVVGAFYSARNVWLLRGALAIFVMILVTSLVSYQAVAITSVADVRYLIGVIPIGFALAVVSFDAIPVRLRMIGALAAVAIFTTNIGAGKFNARGDLESTPLRFVRELMLPVEEPYTPTASWLRQNVPAGASVLVLPDYMMYPLMFHAPEQVYAWQLANTDDPQFRNLHPIHFAGLIPPDYIVAFGPTKLHVENAITSWRLSGIMYEQTHTLPVFWKDVYRPEVFWRTFETRPFGNEPHDGIHIYQRKVPSQ